MKMSCGIDVVAVPRIEKSLRNGRFLEKNFTEEERAHFERCRFRAETVAAAFAAKEAFAKAMKSGLGGFSMNEVSVLHEKTGRPFFRLTGKAEILADGASLSLSLSHDAGIAAAVVLAVWDGERGPGNAG